MPRQLCTAVAQSATGMLNQAGCSVQTVAASCAPVVAHVARCTTAGSVFVPGAQNRICRRPGVKSFMNNLSKNGWLWLVVGGLVLLALFGYNMTSGCPCSSSMEHLGDLPLYGWILLAFNLATFTALLLLRQRNRTKPTVLSCPSCKASLRADWPYCPSCARKTFCE